MVQIPNSQEFIYLFINFFNSNGLWCRTHFRERESHDELEQQAGEVLSRLKLTPSKGGPVDVHEGRAALQRDGQWEEGANRSPLQFSQEPWVSRALEMMLGGNQRKAQFPSCFMNNYLLVNNHFEDLNLAADLYNVVLRCSITAAWNTGCLENEQTRQIEKLEV